MVAVKCAAVEVKRHPGDCAVRRLNLRLATFM